MDIVLVSAVGLFFVWLLFKQVKLAIISVIAALTMSD